jgi:phosphatidylinositol phospholipase C delta
LTTKTTVNIESVREIRFGQDASYYRTQFKLSPELEGRWLTIIYLSKKSTYKMLHLIACDPDTFALWKETLLQILAFRRELLGGLNHMRKRQDYWLKQNWSQVRSSPSPREPLSCSFLTIGLSTGR